MRALCVLVLAGALALVQASGEGCPGNLRECVAGRAVYNETTHCFLCKYCNALRVAACPRAALMPSCNGTTPFQQSNCCFNCMPRDDGNSSGSGRDPGRCDDSLRIACVRALPLLPVCANGTTPTLNGTTCCVNCRPPVPAGAAPFAGRCTKAAIDACAATVPRCAANEWPVPVANSCCPSCRPGELDCEPSDTVACLANQPNCSAGETPLATADCCRSCRAIPECTPACSADQVCVRSRANQTVTVCVARIAVRIRLALRAGVDDATRAAWRNMTCSDRCALLSEISKRFCLTTGAQEPADSNGNNRCQRLSNLLANWQCDTASPVCTSPKADVHDVSVSLPSPGDDRVAPASFQDVRFKGAVPRVLAASADAQALVSDAVADPGAASTFTVDSSAAAFRVSLSLVLLLAVAVFLAAGQL